MYCRFFFRPIDDDQRDVIGFAGGSLPVKRALRGCASMVLPMTTIRIIFILHGF